MEPHGKIFLGVFFGRVFLVLFLVFVGGICEKIIHWLIHWAFLSRLSANGIESLGIVYKLLALGIVTKLDF